MSYFLLLPTITFAFSFECSVLPLVHSLKKKDPTGGRTFSACFKCLLIVTVYYMALMIQSVVFGEIIYSEYEQNKAQFENCNVLLAMNLNELVSYSG
jgi:amino acid permease